MDFVEEFGPKITNFMFQVNGRQFTVDVIDPVDVYLALMKEIFDFPKLQALLRGSPGRPPFKLLLNSMHGGNSHYNKIIIFIPLTRRSRS